MSFFAIQNLHKSFSAKSVIRGMDFEMHKGEVVSILGKNGAGKTTLIKLMTGILNRTSGEILYQGKDIRTYGRKYYQDIGVVLEGDRNIYWYLSGMENLIYFGSLQGMKKTDILRKGEELLRYFGLYEDRNTKVSNYSRGMKQKLSIIISMLNSPKILFLDEPALGLDIWSKKAFIELTSDLIKKENVLVILTSHQLDIVEELAERTILLDDGIILYDGDIRSLKRNAVSGYHIHCELQADAMGKIRQIRSDCIRKITSDKESYIIEVTGSMEDVLGILNQLNQRQVLVTKFYKKERTLEDILLSMK